MRMVNLYQDRDEFWIHFVDISSISTNLYANFGLQTLLQENYK
jgi:hypothetical protein